MQEEQGFLQHLRDHPDDNVTRMVYTDWLEEHGDSRAEYLRLEAQRSLGALTEAERNQLDRELGELAPHLRPEWLAVAGWRFDLVLEEYDVSGQIAIIRALRELTKCSLKVGKCLTEALPGVILLGVPWTEANAARQYFLPERLQGYRSIAAVAPSVVISGGYRTLLLIDGAANREVEVFREMEGEWDDCFQRLAEVLNKGVAELREEASRVHLFVAQENASLAEAQAAVQACQPRLRISVHRVAMP